MLALCSIVLSCASVQLRPLSSGETRLTYMEMPDVVREDLLYEVILSVESEVTPTIKKICFQWVAEENLSPSPSLHNFSMAADFSKGIEYVDWSGPRTAMRSETFCADPGDIRMDIPGRLVVKIRPTRLKTSFNKLEGQAEYISDGRLRTTNRIATYVMVER